MKDRVRVMHIENFTKSLFQVIQVDLLLLLKLGEIIFSALIFHYLIIGSKKTSSPDYKIQENEDTYQAERRIAREIMDTVLRLGLPFKLDQLTEGLGNCFPIAITQQLKKARDIQPTEQY